MKPTRLPGHGTRKAIAYVVGTAVGFSVAIAVYVVVFAKVYDASAQAGYGGRVWWILAFVALVIGSTASSITFWLLERRARRARDAQLPRAQVLP